MTTTTLEARIAEKIDFNGPDGCWVWLASLSKGGYGQVRYLGQTRQAHRSVYRALIGEIPEGLHLDHTCHNADPGCKGGPSCRHRRCVNPAHLEPTTPRVNTLRGMGLSAQRARITHCPQRHPYDAANTLHCVDGKRYCRTCGRDKQRARKARARAS